MTPQNDKHIKMTPVNKRKQNENNDYDTSKMKNSTLKSSIDNMNMKKLNKNNSKYGSPLYQRNRCQIHTYISSSIP